MNLGQAIRELRKKKGLKVKELAKIVGLSPSQVTNIEKQNHATTTTHLQAIALELGVSISTLYLMAEGKTIVNEELLDTKISLREIVEITKERRITDILLSKIANNITNI